MFKARWFKPAFNITTRWSAITRFGEKLLHHRDPLLTSNEVVIVRKLQRFGEEGWNYLLHSLSRNIVLVWNSAYGTQASWICSSFSHRFNFFLHFGNRGSRSHSLHLSLRWYFFWFLQSFWLSRNEIHSLQNVWPRFLLRWWAATTCSLAFRNFALFLIHGTNLGNLLKLKA